ncbi:hypothetical protein [Indiicoccus explosivorum]|uniref:hypothetical protein n=1 Tax=Indiicoccus explosivorum TaxID=1917864 RepID=UPI001185E762|nr:hypothetical protein [Indiicoccus explosivorum]
MKTLRLLAVFGLIGGAVQLLLPVWYLLLGESESTALMISGGSVDLVSMIFILVGLVALNSSRENPGMNWTISFIVAFVGTALFTSVKFIHAFVEPVLMAEVPEILEAAPPSPLAEGMFISFAVFALGWLYFGASSIPGRKIPVAAAILVMVAPFLDFVPVVGYAAPAVWGLGIIWFSLHVMNSVSDKSFRPDLTMPPTFGETPKHV